MVIGETMPSKFAVGEFILKSIKNAGAKSVFGIPGDMVLKFFKVIEDDPDIKLYTFSHEPGVGFAAVASARATRKPAVACVTYGVGGLNMLNAVACAYAEKTPLIVISGGPGEEEKAKDVFLHHTVKDFDSQLKIFREVTCEAVILDSQETAYSKIQKTISACQEFMLPVYIEIPRDMVDKKIFIPEEEAAPSYGSDENAIKEATDEILNRVSMARRPVILVGVEADRFELNDKILTLAKKFGVPIVSDFLTRDVIPKGDPNYFGTYLGEAGNLTAKELVEKADLLLMLGMIITDMNLGIKLKRLKRENIILCFSRRVLAGHHVYNNVPLKLLVEELMKRKVEKKSFSFPSKPKLTFNKVCKYTESHVTVDEIIDAINWFFSEYGEMPIVSDTGDCLFASTKIEARSVIASPYYATMGFGTPAAIGYAVTTGNRPLVLLGDGGFQMTGQEMCHCPRYGINPIFVVFNNKRWGMQQLFYPTARFNELVDWPYSRVAELWGGKGYFCDSCEKLYRALEEAKDNTMFSVIEAAMWKEELSDELLSWLKELHAL
jgi:indolepyruvate decarboxylase